MVLAKPWSSLPILAKLSGLIQCPEMLQCPKIGEGSFQCSLYLSPKVLEVSPIYSSSHMRSPHWYQQIAPLFLSKGSLSLGLTSMFLMVLLPLKWVWIPYLLHMFLMCSPSPCVYGMTMCPLVYLSLVVPLPSGSPMLLSLLLPLCPLWLFPSLLSSWLSLLNLSILSKAHLE